jgi:glycine/D-amino acid oxidase-like deaminating enzyme
MAETADVVVIGAGIIGLNAAFQIVRRSGLRVIVVEKGDGVGEGSTGASSAVCRFRYSRPEMVQLAADGIGAYRQWDEYLQTPTRRAAFHNDGVLWLSDGHQGWAEGEQQRMGELGIRSEVLNDAALKERFPAINCCTLSPDFATGEDHRCIGGGTHLLEVDGGYMDPVDASQDLVDALRGRGADIRFRSSVRRILAAGEQVTGVELASGERIHAGTVINASGPWCVPLFESVGVRLNWPLQPTRIQVVHLDRPAEVAGHIPVCVDPAAGIYFRLQNRGQQIILSSVREEDEKESVDSPDHFARYADDDFTREKLFALQHRLPQLAVRGLSGYSGLYTINQRDVHPLVGRTTIAGLYAANGCSGHGFKLAPAIGALLAGMIVGPADTFDTAVPEEFLAPSRRPLEVHTLSVLA